jgi:hypothetical protein
LRDTIPGVRTNFGRIKMNSEEIKQYICKITGCDYDEMEIEDELLYNAEVVYEGPRDDHRWISYFERVVKVGEKYFSYQFAHCDGDDSIEDQGYTFNWDEVTEVEPVEVKAIEYRAVKYGD